MSRVADFAYAQARMQARHGDRLDVMTWRRIAAVQDPGQFLQNARTTSLRPWLLQLGTESSGHTLEVSLRQQFRDYVVQVARWQPERWRDALLWTRRLVDLESLRHLLAGGESFDWMHEDAVLARLTTDDPRDRERRSDDSGYAALARAQAEGSTLIDAWFSRWHDLWPVAPRRETASLHAFGLLVHHHLDALSGTGDVAGARERFAARLETLFRRHVHEPVAAYLHLALVALDLARLRGALVRRRWNPLPEVEQPR